MRLNKLNLLLIITIGILIAFWLLSINIIVEIVLGIILAILIIGKFLEYNENREIKKDVLDSEKSIRNELDEKDNLAVQEWCRRNDLLHLKETYDKVDFENLLFFSREYSGKFRIENQSLDANSLAYIFISDERYSPFNKFFCLDLSDYIRNPAIQFLLDVFKKCRLYDRSLSLEECFAIRFGKPLKSSRNLIEEINTDCQDHNIGIFFLNIDGISPDIKDFVERILLKIKRVICTASGNTEYVEELEERALIKRRFILPPLDYFAHILKVFQNNNGSINYLGKLYSLARLFPSDLSTNKKIISSILPLVNRPYFVDSYILCGGKTSYFNKIRDNTKSITIDNSLVSLHKAPVIYEELYNKFYKDIFSLLEEKEKELLSYFVLIPFSIHNNDFELLCEIVGYKSVELIEKIKNKLLSLELIYESYSYHYFRFDIEFNAHINNDSFIKRLTKEEYAVILKTIYRVIEENEIPKITLEEFYEKFDELPRLQKEIKHEVLKQLKLKRMYIDDDIIECIVSTVLQEYIESFQNVITDIFLQGKGHTAFYNILLQHAYNNQFLFSNKGYYITSLVRNLILKYFKPLSLESIKKFYDDFFQFNLFTSKMVTTDLVDICKGYQRACFDMLYNCSILPRIPHLVPNITLSADFVDKEINYDYFSLIERTRIQRKESLRECFNDIGGKYQHFSGIPNIHKFRFYSKDFNN